MSQSVRVISTPSSGAALDPVIAVIYDNKRYLFNCGEGTQRHLLSQKIPVKRFTDIFLSSSWDSHGGIAGLLLGLAADTGYPHIALHGPQNVAYYLATLRAGLQRYHRYAAGGDFAIEEYIEQLPPPFEDANIKVQPILSYPTEFNEASWKMSSSQKDRKQFQHIARSVWTGEVTGQDINGRRIALLRPEEQTMVPRKRPFDEAESIAESATEDDGSAKQPESGTQANKPTTFDRAQYAAFLQFLNGDMPSSKPFPAAVSYCIEGQPRPGRFDVQRATALGVPKGPLFGRLQKGETITLADGTTVGPRDVMGPARLSAPALIAHCPSLDYVESFLNHQYWSMDHFKETCGIIIHTGNPEVLSNASYVAWMSSFTARTTHFLSHHLLTGEATSIERSDAHYLALQAVSADQFPIVQQPKSYDKEAILARLFSSVSDVRILKAGQTFALDSGVSIRQPKSINKPVTRQKIDLDDTSRAKPEVIAAFEEYEAAVKMTAEHIREIGDTKNIEFPGSDVEIITLGTGSAGPSIYRNVAGTLVRSPDGFTMLLDCGEGTLGQMERAFGSTLGAEMRKLKLVYVSHLHADHHLGIIGLIRHWLQVNAWNEDKLVVLAPRKLIKSVREYDCLESLSLHRLCMQCTSELYNSRQAPPSTASYQQMLSLLPQLTRAETVPAIHSEKSTCLRLDHRDGWSVAFSGDTRPSLQFMKLGAQVTCLIHEATFQNSKLDEAVKKKHSTLSEALLVSKEMDARITILTHFSQRYPKVPVLEEDNSVDFSAHNIVCANDLMHIKLKDAWKSGLYMKDELDLEKRLEELRMQGTLPAEAQEDIVNE